MKTLSPVALLLAPFLMGATSPTVSDTPAGQFLDAFLTAYNSANPVEIDRYNKRYQGTFPSASWIAAHEDTGDLTVVRVEPDGPNKLTALIAANGSDDFYRRTIVMDPGNASHPLAIEFGPVDRPAEYAVPREPTFASAARALEARAASLIAAGKFAGTMMVEHKDRIIFAKAWGLADREKKLPMTLDTRLRIGSYNKMFTAVSVLQLVQAGKLTLDGRVGDYLPDYPNKQFAAITLRQLLTHTGGAGDIFGPDFDKARMLLKHNDDYMRLYGTRAPDMKDEGRNAYANYGFVVLGAVVERASGEDYYDYVQKHIFKPAGMVDTGSLPEDMPVPRRAKGYTRSNGQLADNANTLPYRGMAAGGGYTTVRDLIRFANALQHDQLISAILLAQATSFQNPDRWYGFGFEVHGDGMSRYWGHGGGAPGMNAAFRVYPSNSIVVVAISNLDPPGADQLATFYANRMPAK